MTEFSGINQSLVQKGFVVSHSWDRWYKIPWTAKEKAALRDFYGRKGIIIFPELHLNINVADTFSWMFSRRGVK